MRVTRSDVNEMLRDALTSDLDAYLAEYEFARRPKATEYSRRVTNGKQAIKIFFALNPSYHPDAIAHIQCQIRLFFPELNEIVSRLKPSHDLQSTDATSVSYSIMLEHLVPQEELLRPQEQLFLWYAQDGATVFSSVQSIREVIRTWAIPFLNEYTDIADLTRGYEQDRKRFVRPPDLLFAAAYVAQGQPAKAMQVLVDHFGRPGPRREHAKAFEYVAALIGGQQS